MSKWIKLHAWTRNHVLKLKNTWSITLTDIDWRHRKRNITVNFEIGKEMQLLTSLLKSVRKSVNIQAVDTTYFNTIQLYKNSIYESIYEPSLYTSLKLIAMRYTTTTQPHLQHLLSDLKFTQIKRHFFHQNTLSSVSVLQAHSKSA